jgi:hypothetical protein
MENLEQYFGFYYFMGLVLDVQTRGELLVAGLPDVPAGYEIILEPVGPDAFRNIGGPVDGTTIQFLRDADQQVTALKAGSFELVKISSTDLGTLPIIERLLPPKFILTPEKQTAFKGLAAQIETAAGGWLKYDLPYPKYEFVQYLTSQDQIIFHGSNHRAIKTFQPLRKSMELMDETGRGNVAAVYGTHNGLWAMFFAIVDRENLEGSIRSGVMCFQNQHGDQISVYNFSVNQDQLAGQPYTEGALYCFPRATFRRLKITPESYANEWASEPPVQPLAKLKLHPTDFPFLAQISGHDDGQLIRLGAISQEIRTAAQSATLDGDYFRVTFPLNATVVSQLDEYINIQRILIPAANFKTESTPERVILSVTGLPPAIQQMIQAQYQELLVELK